MKTKSVSAILLVLVGLLVMCGTALACGDDSFDEVKVDGTTMTGANTAYVERGSTIEVEVWWTAGSDPDVNREDLKLKAWVGGYEYDDVEDTIDMPDMDPEDSIKKSLFIDLPEDMDAREEYTIHVRLYNKKDIDIEEEYSLKISQEKHLLAIQDVVLRPSTVNAGSSMFATIRVENMGYEKEEDIKVTVSIPDLGVSARTYIDELGIEEQDDDNGEPETSGSSEEMKLTIPEDAATGDYEVKVTVEYNRGHDTISATETVHVKAVEPEETVPATLFTVDATNKEIAAGVEGAYKIMVANLGDDSAVFSAEVGGADLWATARVEPAMITLSPDGTGEMYVYIKPKAGAEEGKHSFTVKVKSGNAIVAERTMTADVTGTSTAPETTGATTTEPTTGFASVKNALVIGFGVLVVLLVILGLIIAFNKMNKDEDEELPTSEGQAYY